MCTRGPVRKNLLRPGPRCRQRRCGSQKIECRTFRSPSSSPSSSSSDRCGRHRLSGTVEKVAGYRVRSTASSEVRIPPELVGVRLQAAFTQRDRIRDARHGSHITSTANYRPPRPPESLIRLVGAPAVRRGAIRPLRPVGDDGATSAPRGRSPTCPPPPPEPGLLRRGETLLPRPSNQQPSPGTISSTRGRISRRAFLAFFSRSTAAAQQLLGPIALTEAFQRVAEAALDLHPIRRLPVQERGRTLQEVSRLPRGEWGSLR